MESNELKPCPFCGCKAKIKATIKKDIGMFTIWCQCGNCNAKTSGYCPKITDEDTSLEDIEKCKGYAIEKWNHRADEKSSDKR